MLKSNEICVKLILYVTAKEYDRDNQESEETE